MTKKEIIRRLEKLSRHAVHTIGEVPYAMSLDDGEALCEAVELLKTFKIQRKCEDCKYERRNRLGENYMEGFCKCTGQKIDFNNSTKAAPDWCPLN